MLFKALLLYVALQFGCCRHVQSANVLGHSMKFTKVQLQHNADYYSNISAWITNGSLSADMYTTKTLSYGLRGFVETQISLNAKRYQTLFSYEFDMCRLMNEQLKDSLIKHWFRNILKYSNLMENCPMMEGHYYIRDFKLEAGSIPAYLRKGDYRLNVMAFFGKRGTKSQKNLLKVIADMKIF